ncbi:hypothetical protein [Nocardia alba]|uniref:Uncharacterized protein n=1 Tax=Nocardia alba TaxID=225051 RepID=A0A4R1FRQ3_9NOCA|nr:hypothetical protein [Nocardia alba]TCJ97453.1 hypothetical protein DFR71_3495 [Nocardia alba]
MDSRDIIAQWRRDIALADNGGEEAAIQRLRGEWFAAAGIDVHDGLPLNYANGESSRRTAFTDDDRH